MRWFRICLFIIGLVFIGYLASKYFIVEEDEIITIEKEIDYPVDKLFPQFINLQNFVRWNEYFSTEKYSINYYTPYEGEGSSVTSKHKKNGDLNELFIKYVKQNRAVRYHLFAQNSNKPIQIDVVFDAKSNNRTKVIWNIKTLKQNSMLNYLTFWEDGDFSTTIDNSMSQLRSILSNKVDKDIFLTGLKFDSIMLEKQEEQMILGVNVSTSNKKDALYKNILMNYNKMMNFLTVDLSKKEDEIGFPILITDADGYKNKEISYFLGAPISKKEVINDNNFQYMPIESKNSFIIYYKGSYEGRVSSIQKLLQKAIKDSFKTRDVHQVFLENPKDNNNVIMKLILPVDKL